jgi:nucleotide-binding universal stress UspA family protein
MNLAESDRKVRLELVVGYDGSEPAQRALEGAVQMMDGRKGHLEVVFVAHVPAMAATNAVAMVEVANGFEEEEMTLFPRVADALRDRGIDWSFQRRNGNVADELLAVAAERLQRDVDARVVMVLGGSANKLDRYLNSTATRVIRRDRFSTLVIP